MANIKLPAITPDTTLRLAKAFNTTPRFWLNMQASYDLATADADISKIEAIEKVA